PAMPDVPTLKEAGVSGAESSSWVALLGPRDMPKEIAEKIAATVKKIVESPKMRENLIAQGATGVGSTPDELDQVIKTDRQRYGDIIRTL
ncbi:tripartite tricarboxylate transporter substrate-binding protein, partial [Salmonella enterica subsp. enterica serovar 1,4,[5],12:i:-]